MSFYHVYAGQRRMMLRAVTDDFEKAKAACTAIRVSRPFPDGIRHAHGVAGVVTGTPVWVRYFGQGPALMITCLASDGDALAAEDETFCDVIAVQEKAAASLVSVP